jgi:beta-xylosidase/AraC-like DNA-binding protein
MQNYQFPKNSIIGYDFFEEKTQPIHVHSNIEIFYLLEGETVLWIDKKKFMLKQDDFIVINTNIEHYHKAVSNVLYACFHINYYELCHQLSSSQLFFSCNSTLEKSVELDDFQSVIKSIFNQHTKSQQSNNFLLTSLYFNLLAILVNHFRILERPYLSSEKETDEARIRKIHSFLNSNYKDPISLEELAYNLFLTPAYLSKYIKNHFHMNYTSLLNEIRLSHAIEEMETTDKSITQIAMNNGFPNVTSLDRILKRKHGKTPSAYAKTLRSLTPKTKIQPTDLSQKVNKYIDHQMQEMVSDKSVIYKTNVEAGHLYNKSFNRMINIGGLSDIFNFNFHDHLLTMKKELGFEYIRFWDLYSSIMQSKNGDSCTYNFSKLDRIFDLFIDTGIRPYIELGFKPTLVLSSVKKSVDFMVSKQKTILFKTPSEYEFFLKSFITHYTNRYRLDEIEKWYFEQWIDPRQIIGENYNTYFDMFEVTYRTLKSASPNIRVGGGGLTLKNIGQALNAYFKEFESVKPVENANKSNIFLTDEDYSAINSDFSSFLSAWQKRPCHPDFFSMYCFPYTNVNNIKNYTSMRDQVLVIHDEIENAGFSVPEFHISEWNFTASDRNALNDGCFKSAYIVKSALDTMQLVDLMGHWSASDLYAESSDTNQILNGCSGLISCDGIKKPAYYAFNFLNKMGKYLLFNEGHCAITSNGADNYTIICHFYSDLNYIYFLKSENEITISEQNRLFEPNEKIRIQCQIENVRNGNYSMRIHSLNSDTGSVQNEWLRMGLLPKMNKDDVEYLRQICTPRISIRNCIVKDHILIIDTILEAQEIQCIQLDYMIFAIPQPTG